MTLRKLKIQLLRNSYLLFMVIDKKDNQKLKKDVKPKEDKAKPVVNKEEKKTVSEVTAKARYVRISPKKVRLVINQLRGKSAIEVLDHLRFVNKRAVGPVTKLIKSAIANAENNFSLDKNDLYIKEIIANDGPILRRWKPRAYGRSTPIRKRSSHIELVLGLKSGPKKVVKKEEKVITKPQAASQKAKSPEAKEVKVVSPDEVKRAAPTITGKGPEDKGQKHSGILKKIFSRKTGTK